MCYDCTYPGELAQMEPDDDSMCDSCTCCSYNDCMPAACGEDENGRFHCPCTSE